MEAGDSCGDILKQKSHLLNCKCDTFVNITSPTQLQDGTTYDSISIMHQIYTKSIKKFFAYGIRENIAETDYIREYLLSILPEREFHGERTFNAAKYGLVVSGLCS